MFELIREHQLDIMLILCGSCGILVFLLAQTKVLSGRRKGILILMELMAIFLLWFDRLSYIYAGNPGREAYVMVRVSNFMVFFLTSGIVFGFDLYLMDLLRNEGKTSVIPLRLKVVCVASMLGMLMVFVAAYTNFYYYFDEHNVYHRGPGFLISYIIPVLCPIVQYTAIIKYREKFRKLIYISLVTYLWVPVLCGILQVFTYGISIVNMAMVAVSISLYIFMYLDLNDVAERSHEKEMQSVLGEKARMQRLFDETARAFVSAVEKKDDFTRGNALRIAEYAKKIAEAAGKGSVECEKVYYAALLHDVGMIGIPDSVIKNEEDPDKWDIEAFRKKPIIGSEILASISEYPFLYEGARYSHERYNGTGYPEGLRGEAIPEIARIIAVADAYVTMITKKRYRDARPGFAAREAFIKGSGEEFDPVFSDIMVGIIDMEAEKNGAVTQEAPEKELECHGYRERISKGISVTEEMQRISFDCEVYVDPAKEFSAPSLVLFDAYDGRAHDNEKSIKSYHYTEYGEIWFDRYSVTTGARKIEEKPLECRGTEINERGKYADKLPVIHKKKPHYEILAGRFDDHLKITMKSSDYCKEVTVALYGNTNSAYIGLTGENCRLINIEVEKTGERVGHGDIERIAEPVSYIDHLQSDIKNVQVDGDCSAYTDGVLVQGMVKLAFHTMTLPGAELVWNCPYVVLFGSDDGQVGGPGYREYAFIKLNGENRTTAEHAKNRFRMKKMRDFPGWEKWKSQNLEGMECMVSIQRKDNNSIILKTENLGISIENITTIEEEADKVYAALTGDRIALTDIRLE